ncbi:MFS transporter [Corynebacterium mastitidis]|uniref:MFS transporter n=1 Tax=Corynebacterium mastitidis TaxID=161890 RepID=UPI00157D8569|nr:MFS transporter [Corynebacterium mastitidis]MCH6197084.1 MFS transporter [Corynebacterium mastitidis]
MLTTQSSPRLWLRVALSMFAVAWGGNQFTSMIVFYRGEGEFADLFVDSMLAIYAVGVGVGLLVAGSLSDHWGRKAVMLPAPGLAMAASVLIAAGEHYAPVLASGRFVAGLALGIAMTAGGSWLKELSMPPHEPDARASAGAKRASMTLTIGLALGPLTAGVLAQWASYPGQLIYAVHIALTLAVYPLLFRVPETHRGRGASLRDVLSDASVPSLRSRRFLTVVAPMAPWVFGCSFTAQTIITSRLQGQIEHAVAYTGMISLITMGCGFAIQQVGPRFDSGGRRGPVSAMALAAGGMACATLTAMHPTVWGGVACAILLGMAYGLAMFIGLAETQRIALPEDLAGLTGIYYCCTYLGMMFPALLTFLGGVFTYPQMLGFGVLMASAGVALETRAARRRPPGHR